MILYNTTLEAFIGALLAQSNDEEKECEFYYLSCWQISSKVRYPPMERYYLALIFTIDKLQHYMLAHKRNLISRANPLHFLVTRSTLSRWLEWWSMILS